MVVVHGFTGIPGHWRLAAEFLSQKGYTVVAPLLPGHGTSVEEMAKFGAPDWLRAVVESALTVSDHRRVHLAGLSLGGLLAILAAGPTNAASVTAISAPLRFRRKGIYLAPFLHPFRPYTAWTASPPAGEPETAELFQTYSGFPTRKATDLLVVARQARRAARRLRRPSLVVQSLIDESVDPRSARVLIRALGTGTQTLWLQHSRHNALLDRERGLIHEALLRRLTTA
ncbi:MAG TPA: alpha/beta fold hydrolase [Acidimicrobiia bacterium]|nr:alpha/beta fold hydrolase [Acidimicrobiia bacterium]